MSLLTDSQQILEKEAQKTKRERKNKARATEIVLGAIDERLQMIENNVHAARLAELMDELRRSLNTKGSEGEE